MCERTCPACGSKNHVNIYGMAGFTIRCDECGLPLAHKADPDWAPIDHPDPDVWAENLSGVVEGAEAADPDDDKTFGAKRWPLICMATET